MITRRRFLHAGGAALCAGFAGKGPLLAHASTRFGTVTIDTLSDGYLTLPRSFLFGENPDAGVLEILARHGVTDGAINSPCNVTLLRDDTNTVLFDAGSGSGFMPTAGTLIDTLDTLNVAPEDITHVVFTHAHPDHLWGVLDDFDDPVFTNASYLIGRAEWDYWINPETVDTIGEARASFAVGAKRRLEAIEDTVEFFDAGNEILPGIAAVDSSGHTPGHMSFEVRSGSEAVMVVGDAIGNGHVAFARPETHSGSDHNMEKGAVTTQALLDRLATDQMPMIGFHLPGGGLGRVARHDGNYRFVPEES